MYYNPCSCLGRPINPPPPGGGCPNCDNKDDCLYLCHIVVQPKDSVGPCGKVGEVDLMYPEGPGTDSPHTTTICNGAPVEWALADISTPDLIANAKVTPSGKLQFITGNPNAGGKVGQVYVKGQCGMYAAYVQVLIGIKDMCADKVYDNCDPCSGLQVNPLVNVKVNQP